MYYTHRQGWTDVFESSPPFVSLSPPLRCRGAVQAVPDGRLHHAAVLRDAALHRAQPDLGAEGARQRLGAQPQPVLQAHAVLPAAPQEQGTTTGHLHRRTDTVSRCYTTLGPPCVQAGSLYTLIYSGLDKNRLRCTERAEALTKPQLFTVSVLLVEL